MLFPAAAVPLLNTIDPLSPDDHDPPDPTSTAPLSVSVVPLLSTTDPDVPVGPRDDPDTEYTAPLLPDPVVPLLNTIDPDAFTDTAFADRTGG